MIRTQIYFPEDLHKKLKRLADKQGVSLAEVLRVAAQELIENQKQTQQQQKVLQFFSEYPHSRRISLDSKHVRRE